MTSDFQLVDGIYLVQGSREPDLHDNYAFREAPASGGPA